MNRRLLWRVLGSCAFALALLLFYELRPLPDIAPLAVAAGMAEEPLPPRPPPRDVPQWVDTVQLRPLFDPSRKGELAVAGGQPAELLPRLSGILLADGEKRAIFQPDGGKKPVVVSLGDQVAGWTVRGIVAEAVTIGRGGATQTLQPKFDAKPKAAQSGQGGR
jgi:hypothetical protein